MKQNSGMRIKDTILKYCLLLSLAMVWGGALQARTPANDSLPVFTDIPAVDYPVTEQGLPEFVTRLELEHEGAAGMRVRLTYPEYKPLSAAESRIVDRRFARLVADTVVTRTEFGISRKRGMLDVSICPVIRRNGKYFRLVSCKLDVVYPESYTRKNAKSRAGVERWKSGSVLASGRWVRIRVEDEGIYQLTAARLSEMGFRDISRVKLYGYGGRVQEENWTFTGRDRVPDDLNEVPLFRRNGSVLFFAEGTVRWTWNSSTSSWTHRKQLYSNYSYYFLTEGDAPAVPETIEVPVDGLTATVDEVCHHALMDKDAVSFYAGGRELYDDYDFKQGTSHTFRLAAPGLVSGQQSTVDVGLAAANSVATPVQVELNGASLGRMSIEKLGSEQSARESRYSFKTEHLSGENQVAFSLPSGTDARLNYIRFSYPKRLDAADGGYAFSLNRDGKAALSISNASASTHVWRIATAGSPMADMAGTLEGGTLLVGIPDARDRYVIVDVNKEYPSPQVAGEVPNQDLHASAPQDMVIIVPSGGKLTAQAERLAEAHRQKDGLRVAVVTAQQLYNEFSSGTPDASAYRRFMKMLYDRAETDADLPKYLLLFGDCAWDNRMITSDWRSSSPDDFLLSFELNTESRSYVKTEILHGKIDSYVTDDFYGWLDDGEGLSYVTNKLDLGIGRFPCTDESTATVYVDKVIAYMDNGEVGNWKNKIYFLADDINDNLHMDDAEEVVKKMEAQHGNDIYLRKVYWDAYKRTSSATGFSYPQVTSLLRNYMKQGALMFNYTGHGSPLQISHSNLLTDDDFRLSSSGRFPLWVLASCEICPYDTQTQDIGRVALGNPDGGAIAMMCASRSVYSNYNRSINARFTNNVLSTSGNGKAYPMGEALRLTKVGLIEGSGDVDRTFNKLKYVLLGDPALSLAVPTHRMVIDSINGHKLADGERFQLKAGSVARFSGYVAQGTGIATGFDGLVSVTVMDRMEKIVCKKNDYLTSKPMEYNDRTKVIFEGQDSVMAGRFSVEVSIPRDISYTEDSGRIMLYAVNKDHSMEAHGHNDQFYLDGTDSTVEPDKTAPTVYLYLNTPDFPNGGIVGPDAVFVAEVSDDCGINVSGISVGHDLELTLDNDVQNTHVLNEYFSYDFGSYRTGTVTYPLTGLSAGKHSLSFKVWDVNNNPATSVLDFYVGSRDMAGFEVSATRNPAYTTTSFVTLLPEHDSDVSVTIEVYDMMGKLVWISAAESVTGTSGYHTKNWNLTNAAGVPLPAGVYLYRAKVTGANGEMETDAKKMVIIKQ